MKLGSEYMKRKIFGWTVALLVPVVYFMPIIEQYWANYRNKDKINTGLSQGSPFIQSRTLPGLQKPRDEAEKEKSTN
ncbi:hypothetical protein SNE40_023396 [Patella caerulea]|uniref:Uncharacterized protein n=1 Tax=Patella caerulea TaxID=87958 RepID=A0AAN8IYN1_PATCE